MKIDHVFFPTVYQSGTWFVANILHHRAGYIFKRYKDEVQKKDLLNLPFRTTVHAHILGEIAPHEIQEVYKLLNKNGRCLTVVPIRDVLLSILSQKRRIPDVPAYHIIDSYALIARKFAEYNPFYFPVYLHKNPLAREKILKSLEVALGSNLAEINGLDNKRFAEMWPVENDTKTFCMKAFGDPRMEFKQAYELKEVAYLKHVIEPEWDYLIKNRGVLKPFFESLGYKNLLWYKGKK